METTVFEVGKSLSEAREKRGLSYADVERDTCIRARFTRALEEEAFQLFPSGAYAKAFLREYADYLDLDAERFVDEFSSRFAPEEGPESHVTLQPIAGRGFRPSLTSALVAGAALVAALLAIWLVGIGGTGKHVGPGHSLRPAKPVAPPPPSPPAAPPKPRLVRLTLTAVRGPCWLDAHAGSQTGRELHMGMLDPGQSIRLTGKRIWLRLGAPTVLTATLNGKTVVFPRTSPVDVLVRPAGIQTTS